MYTEFYRFSEKPFEDVLDPRFFYRTPGCQKILTSLLTWTKEGHGFAVITGEAGTGKTLFIQTLSGLFGEKTKTVVVPNPAATFKELLKQIFRSLEQPAREETKTALLHRFMRCLKQLAEQGETLIIVLDESQDLSHQVLEDVQHFLGLKSKPLRTLLVGQPGLDSILEAPGLIRLRQRIKIRVQMKAFSKEESLGYMAWRLRAVGGHIDLFSPKAVSLVFHYSQGVPSLMNHVCDNALRLGCTMNRKVIDVDLVEKTIRNLEGPGTPKKVLLPVRGVKPFRRFLPSFNALFKRVSIGILLLACMAGLALLLYHYLGQGGVKPWEKESFVEQKPVSRPSQEEPLRHPPVNPLEKETDLPAGGPAASFPKTSEAGPSEIPVLTPERRVKTLVVKRGQYLFSLAKECYQHANPTLVDLILNLNPEITNAHQILVDQKVVIPTMTEDLLLIPSPDQTFRIHLGTFLGRDIPRPYSMEKALKGKQIEMIPRRISPTESWYRVVVGTFKDRDEALETISRLKEKGLLPSFGGKFAPE